MSTFFDSEISLIGIVPIAVSTLEFLTFPENLLVSPKNYET